jgi:hypothetical protein
MTQIINLEVVFKDTHLVKLELLSYSMKLDLLTNATVVDDAIRFVSSGKSKENLESSPNSSEDNKEEAKEPDYDEDEDQLEEEPAELTSAVTTNQIF